MRSISAAKLESEGLAFYDELMRDDKIMQAVIKNFIRKRGKLSLFFVLLGWMNSVFGQDKFITLKKEPLEIPDRDFYIQAVIDARTNRSDIGFAQVGPFNKKVRMKFAQSVEAELMAYFQEALPPQANQRPVIVKLFVLGVGERTAMFSETALVVAKMAFYVEQDRRLGKIYEAEAQHKRGAMDVTKFHEENLRLVIARCLEDFSKSNWRTVTPVFTDSITMAASATDAGSRQMNFEHGQPLANELKRYMYSFGVGGFGAWQQNKMPMQFGSGLRVFFSYRDLRRLRFELGMDYVFARPMAQGNFFAFGNDVVTYAFSQGRQLNFDLTGKIAFADYPRHGLYFLLNFAATSLHSTDGKVLTNATLAVSDAKASISGIGFGGGLGYQHYLSKRMFIDCSAVFNFVVISTATGGDKTGKLPQSISSKAEMLKVQLGFDF